MGRGARLEGQKAHVGHTLLCWEQRDKFRDVGPSLDLGGSDIRRVNWHLDKAGKVSLWGPDTHLRAEEVQGSPSAKTASWRTDRAMGELVSHSHCVTLVRAPCLSELQGPPYREERVLLPTSRWHPTHATLYPHRFTRGDSTRGGLKWLLRAPFLLGKDTQARTRAFSSAQFCDWEGSLSISSLSSSPRERPKAAWSSRVAIQAPSPR